jgi:hypothetical protein
MSTHRITFALIVAVAAAGCSAAGVPIAEPEHLAPLSTQVPLSEFEAIAWPIRDVMVLAVPTLLRAPPGDLDEQLAATGTMTLSGAAAQPSDSAETLTLSVGYDGYAPRIHASVPFTDWRLSSDPGATSTLILEFTDEPADTTSIGYINGRFDGTVVVARSDPADRGDAVDARLTIRGQLWHDAAGKVMWTVLHVSGVIHSSAYGYYWNDASFPDEYNTKKEPP